MKRAAMLIAALAFAQPAIAKTSLSAKRGLAFAEARCAACHGVRANATSPNPESPTFEDIANYPDLTAQTLRDFLRDSHNYPAAMQFRIDRRRIADLANYMVTLRRPGYTPSR